MMDVPETIADTVSGVKGYLLAEPSVAELVEERVFYPKLPPKENTSMPRHAITMHDSGRPRSFGYVQLSDVRIDVNCWGATPNDARKLHNVVVAALKHLMRVVRNGVLLHSATLSSEMSSRHDPDTGWPVKTSVWVVQSSDIPIEEGEPV